MKRTFITAMAAMMLCIPSFAEDTAPAENEVKAKKEKKNVTYNEKDEQR